MVSAKTSIGTLNAPNDPVDAVDFWIEFGMKVKTACAKVGIPRATYYDHKKRRSSATQEKSPGSSQHGGTAHHSHGDSTPPQFTPSPSAAPGGPDALPN